MTEDIYVDFSGRFAQNLFIGVIIGDPTSIQNFWKNNQIYSSFPHSTFSHLKKGQRIRTVSALENSKFQIVIGIFPKNEYTIYNEQIIAKLNWKPRLLNILLYLTIRNHIFKSQKERVNIEKGEYDSWIPIIEKRINRFTKPFGTSVLIRVENKYHPGILLADHVAGIAQNIYSGEINTRNRFEIVKLSNFEYYIKREFRL